MKAVMLEILIDSRSTASEMLLHCGMGKNSIEKVVLVSALTYTTGGNIAAFLEYFAIHLRYMQMDF